MACAIQNYPQITNTWPNSSRLLMTLYPLLGTRRQEAIRTALVKWRQAPIRKPNGTFRAALCHPERMYYAKGLCELCHGRRDYYKHRKVTNPRIEDFEQSVSKL